MVRTRMAVVTGLLTVLSAVSAWLVPPAGAQVGGATIATAATPSATLGAPITDTATVTGAPAPAPTPTGVVTFTVFGPGNPTCTGAPIFTSPNRPLSGGPPTATSSPFVPPSPGSYHWVAVYSGDVNYVPVTSPCGAPGEVSFVSSPPLISVDKTATPLTRPEPGGDFTFNIVVTNVGATPVTITTLTDDVYGNLTTRPGSTCNTAVGTVLQPSPGPNNTYSCSFTAPFTGNAGQFQVDTVTVSATDAQGSQAFDTDDARVDLTGVAPSIQVNKDATPPSRPAPGGDFTYSIVVTNTGTFEAVTITSITDSVYGNLAIRGTCTTAVGTVLAPSPGPGNTYSCSFTAPFNGVAGATLTDVVTVVAQDDDGTSTTDNDDAIVSLTGSPVATIATSATPTALLGSESIQDTATVTGAPAPAPAPTGTVDFTAFGPDDATCSGPPVFTSSARPLSGGSPPTATSGPFVPTAAGTYRWVAVYSGDANYLPAASPCNSAGETSVVVDFGQLRVTTSPALPSQILIDGIPRETFGLNWLKLVPGTYTLSFTHVEGWTEPAPQTVTVSSGAVTTVAGSFTQRGLLHAVTSPAVQGTISVDGIPRNNWGVYTDLPTGSHQVCFGPVAGFNPPACQTVSLGAGVETLVTGSYVANAAAPGPTNVGELRVVSSPAVPTQVLVDGLPRDTWGLTWLSLAPGTYTVSFSHVEGFTEPAPSTVTVTAGAVTTVTGTFIRRGTLEVKTSPAVQGTISVDGIPRDDWGLYTDLPTGARQVCFGPVPGFTRPSCTTATLSAGMLTTVTGTYT